ncbi:MAG: hypothetical protein DWQ04_01960, partial [Chloroflexi bacterium]
YEYVPLRHVPVAADSFAFYGEDLLKNIDALPTWVYTTPHNIQKNTPQTETCESCHNNPDLFLTADKVAEHELFANRNVIVDTVPMTPTLGIEMPPVEVDVEAEAEAEAEAEVETESSDP